MLLVDSQEQFDEYIKQLSLDEKCYFCVEKGLSLCNCPFKCRFQGRDKFTIRAGRKKECIRDKAVEIMKMF